MRYLGPMALDPEKLQVRPFDPAPLPRPRIETLPPVLPVDLEIGCGAGLHPIQYCQRHPDRRLIAIEHTRQKFEKFEGRLAQHPPLPNLTPVHANAISWVVHHLPPRSVERCFLLYPNPNPKAGDRNKRWYAMPFMYFLVERLVPGGCLVLATNEPWYASEAEQFLTTTFGLTLEEKSQATEGRTHFERKFLRQGEPCTNLVFKRADR